MKARVGGNFCPCTEICLCAPRVEWEWGSIWAQCCEHLFAFAPVLYPAADYPPCWGDLVHPIFVYEQGKLQKTQFIVGIAKSGGGGVGRGEVGTSKSYDRARVKVEGWWEKRLIVIGEKKLWRWLYLSGALKDEWEEQ